MTWGKGNKDGGKDNQGGGNQGGGGKGGKSYSGQGRSKNKNKNKNKGKDDKDEKDETVSAVGSKITMSNIVLNVGTPNISQEIVRRQVCSAVL